MDPYRPPSAKPTAENGADGVETERRTPGISRLSYFLIVAGLMLSVSTMAGLSAPVKAGKPLPDPDGTRMAAFLSMTFLCVLGSMWATFCRLENMGANRWWSLMMLVPGLNIVAAVI